MENENNKPQDQQQTDKTSSAAKSRKHSNDYKKSKDRKGIPTRNDWRWYALSEQIAKDIGSIPYSNIPGVPLEIDYLNGGESGTTSAKMVQPSCMAIEYVNTPGKALNRTDGINMAATQLYTFVRHVNSGAVNYEAADMMMYILAMRDIYAHYFECKRALGLARFFTVNNRNFPDTISQALNIDLREVAGNIALYRGQLNTLAHKINSFAVPKYFKAFERAAYISSGIFGDSTSLRGQFYVFRRGYYYSWSTTTSSQGTELVATKMTNNSMATRIMILTEMLDCLFLDTDANTMSGDILKAFNDAELYGVAETSDDYIVAPTYDEDILNQIENCVFSLGWENFPSEQTIKLNVTQSNQLITFNPTMSGSESSAGFQFLSPIKKYVFNSHKDEPTYQDTLEWSRLMTVIDEYKSEQQKYTCTFAFGLEFVLCVYVYVSGSRDALTFQQHDATPTPEDVTSLAALSQFDWHPLVYLHDHHTAEGLKSVYVFGDLKKYTTIDMSLISRIHDNACQSCYYAEDLYSKARRNQSRQGSSK